MGQPCHLEKLQLKKKLREGYESECGVAEKTGLLTLRSLCIFLKLRALGCSLDDDDFPLPVNTDETIPPALY